jgi:NAD(P)-dependent dehydrogenase (short-subunit alcohol dehydrogenase family)
MRDAQESVNAISRHTFDLSGKIALVTGAGSGLGSQFSGALSSAGAKVLCVDLNIESASRTADRLKSLGGAARALSCDVCSSNSVERMSRELGSDAVDILVNNAGIVSRARRTHEISEDEWDRVLDVNLKGTFLCSKAIIPIMLAGHGGSIINLASVLGLRGYYPQFPAVSANYFASKAGIVGLTKQLAVEYAADGIRANVICPAFHEGTALGAEWRSLRSPEEANAFARSIDQRTPMGRKGRPEELDGLIVYLAGNASSYVTGQVFSHDGGWTAA